MQKTLPAVLLLALMAAALPAQTVRNFFQPVAESAIALPAQAKLPGDRPTQYRTFQLDYPAAVNLLQSAPREFTAAARAHACIVSLPMADGSQDEFAVWETAMMEPALAAQFPTFHTYAGESVNNPGRIVRMSCTARGLRATVYNPDGNTVCLRPFAYGQTKYYLVYDRKDQPADPLKNLQRLVLPNAVDADAAEPLFSPQVEERGLLQELIELKIFRFAVATTGEFAQDHGGTKDLVFSAVTEYTNEVSALFERDIDIRLQLVAGSEQVTYLDPETDPYSGTEVGQWMSQNGAVLGTILTPGAFDLGHVYARYISGGAIGVSGGIGVACGNSKAAGCSAGNGSGDYGDGFINTIGQEVGHQLGGGHTWNRCGGGGGRQGVTAFEPGSGSTIMSYAGACGSDNVQFYSDLYYHAGSIEEIRTYSTTGPGGACGSLMTTSNLAPEVTLPYQDGFFIPIETPFELNGSATDADGDPLSYCWEEMDTGPEVPLDMPAGTSPLFRTRLPVTATNRYFPRLSTVINNGFDLTEQLPTYTRDLNFRLTARDNRMNGGGVGWADVAFKATETAGPFKVTAPNGISVIWRVGELVAVTWDVAHTDNSLVNCKKVNIRLSTDGGNTYPITLASGEANDGTAYIQVPDNLTSTARVRIDAADNVFYDISNANFKIQQPVSPSLTMAVTNDVAQVCLPQTFSTEVLSAGVLGFSNPVSLDVTGTLPPGASLAFSKSTINPGESSILSLDLDNVTTEGIFVLNVRAIANGVDTVLRPITLTLVSNDFSAFALTGPADGATGLQQTQILHWHAVADANTYEVQFSNTPSFDTLLYSKSNVTADSLKIPLFLEKGTGYYWRVRPVNECGTHDWAETFFFATLTQNCSERQAEDLPKNISASSTPTVESKITVPPGAGGIINDLNVSLIKGTHGYFSNLTARLISPQGTEVILFDHKCANLGGVFNFALDDNAPGGFPCPPANNGNSYRPENPLSPFNGQSSEGTWTLRVKDNVIGEGGAIEGFQLEFCATVTLNPPFLVNNNILSIATGTNEGIPTDLLLTEDLNNSHNQLIYTLVTAPKHGRLELNWGGELQPGAHFTQADIDGGALRYFDYGFSAQEDYFRFTVTDGEGGFLGTPAFIIQPQGVGTGEPGQQLPGFTLYPNPATDAVWVAFDQSVRTDTPLRLFNAAGQLLMSAVLPAGADRLQFQVGALPKGIYLVQVQNEVESAVKKLVLH